MYVLCTNYVLLGVVPTAQPIIINHHLWSTADRDAELISFATSKHGTFKHASEASFFELAPALMHGLGVPNWQPDEYAFGRILRFFFMALPGAADVDASMYAEVAIFSRGEIDSASGLPTISLDRVIPMPRVIPARLLVTPIIAAPLLSRDQESIMSCARKARARLAAVDSTSLKSQTRLKVKRQHRLLTQCDRDLQVMGGTCVRVILGGTINLSAA